ncbi:DUF2493 domain-containing protein [Spartinivicinus ruber]|uniref:DUF2493 domain-containing protein n=1 Tax=Spartinivicinus ruber TaxID=2683272 RepID=UPI0013D01794|nr:DUF2493 domain-containing protein [Spartinivicinus ruber]
MENKIYFISGHLDLTKSEFIDHYRNKIDAALSENAHFVVGDAKGADLLAQEYLCSKSAQVVVYHMFDSPRNNVGFPLKGSFTSDNSRDKQMTLDSTHDIGWIRPGKENSGTARNLQRRNKLIYRKKHT